MLLYKYLINWRNQVNNINLDDKNKKYRNNILNILLNKNDKENIFKAFNKWRYNKQEKIPINAYNLGIKKIKKLFCAKPFNYLVNKLDKANPIKLVNPFILNNTKLNIQDETAIKDYFLITINPKIFIIDYTEGLMGG